MNTKNRPAARRALHFFTLLGGGLILALLQGCTSLVDLQQCRSNVDCIVGLGLADSICTSEGRCASVLTADCPRVIGAALSEDPVLLAHMTKLTGANKVFGDASEPALTLALDDFNSSARGGLPIVAGQKARKLAALICDDEQDAQRAAHHIVDYLKLQVLIGPVFSQTTIDVAKNVTIPGRTLMINPFSVAEQVADLEPHGLVFRTAISNREEATGMWLFTKLLINNSIPKLPMMDPAIRIAVIQRPDVYGRTLGTKYIAQAQVNGCTTSACRMYVKPFEYPDPQGKASPLTPALLTSVADFNPTYVVLMGTAEMPSFVINGLEAEYKRRGLTPPTYLGSEGCKTQALITQLGNFPDLKSRVYTFAPRLNADLDYAFAQHWQSRFPMQTRPDVYGSTGTYDAAYLIAYAMVGMGDKSLTSSNIVAGINRLVPGPMAPAISVGTEHMDEALKLLSSPGQTINLTGITSDLDYDLAVGDAPGNYDILCASTASPSFQTTRVYFNTKTKALVDLGTFTACQ